MATAILTGLRKGELCGLQKTDVGLGRRLLTVRRSDERPFPKSSQRVVRIPEELVPFLGATTRRRWRRFASRLVHPWYSRARPPKKKAGTPTQRTSRIPAFDAARGTGFEPVAFGSGVGSGKLAGGGQVSQALGISGKQADQIVTDSDAFTPFRSSLGIPLVSKTGCQGAPVPERLLTVREVAKGLNVSASTVYKLCAEGKLAHVRVSNAIRVHPAVLAGCSGDEK